MIDAQKLKDLVDKLVRTLDSGARAKQYLEGHEVKNAIDLLRKDGGELANKSVKSKLTENADVRAAIIRDSVSEADLSKLNDQELLDLVDKLVRTLNSGAVVKQFLEICEVKNAIDSLVKYGGEPAYRSAVVYQLMKNADVLAAIIGVSASEQLFGLLSTQVGGIPVLCKFVIGCENTSLAQILQEIKNKVTTAHWDNLVFQQNLSGVTIIDMVLSKSEIFIKQCARNGTFNELALLLKQYNNIVDKDYVQLQKTMELYEVDFIDLLVVLHLKQQVALDKLCKCEQLEWGLQKLCVMSQSMDKEQAQASRGPIMELFGNLQMSVLQVAMRRWSFWRTLVDDTEKNHSVSFEGLINATTADYKGQSEQETSFVRTLLSSKSGREAAVLFKELWDGEIVLMLVKDAVMLRAVLSSINDEKEIHDLLTTNYRGAYNSHRNIDHPAILQLLTLASKEQCEPILRVIFEFVKDESLRESLMLVNDGVGETLLHTLIKDKDKDLETADNCAEFICKTTPHLTVRLLLKRNFSGDSYIKLLLQLIRKKGYDRNTILDTVMKKGITNKLGFLSSLIGNQKRTLAHEIMSVVPNKGAKLLEALTSSERYILLSTQDTDGNTPLHELKSPDYFSHTLKDITDDEKEHLLTTKNNVGNTCFHHDIGCPRSISELSKLICEERVKRILSVQNDNGETLFHTKFLPGKHAGDHPKPEYNFNSFVYFVTERPSDLDISDYISLKDSENMSALGRFILAVAEHTTEQKLLLKSLLKSFTSDHLLKILNTPQHHKSTAAHLICGVIPDLMSTVLGMIPNDIPKVLNALDDAGESVIHILARRGQDYDVQDVVLKLPDESLCEVMMCQNKKEETVLHILASRPTAPGVVQKILAKLRSVDLLSKENKSNTATAINIAALLNRQALSDMVETLGIGKVIKILCKGDQNFNVKKHFCQENKKDEAVRKILKQFSTPSRSTIEAVLSCNNLTVRTNLRELISEIDKGEIKDAITAMKPAADKDMEPEKAAADFKMDTHKLMAIRYAYGDTILHALARREDLENLKRLLGVMTPRERSHWLDVPNFALKKPHDVARSFETRQLLKFASAKQDEYFMPIPPQVLIMYSSLDRDGADEEAKNLEAAFLKIVGRKFVTLKKDLSKDEILKQIDKVALADPAPSAMFVVVIAHGKDGNVMVGKDQKGKERLKIQDILDRMCEVKEDHTKLLLKKLAKAKTAVEEKTDPQGLFDEMKTLVSVKKDRLEGKPKVLLLQACQTGTDQHNPVIDRQEPGFSVMRRDVIALSGSVRGEPAKRNTMIPIFAEELQNPEHSGEIYEMFLRTNYRFTLMNKPQIPIVHSTLTQKLFLKSPLWNDFQTEVNTEQSNADE